MSSRNVVIIIIVALIVLMGGCTITGYNSLVKADQNVKDVWGNVQTNYQRRTDLYGSVIKVVQGSANFEKSTLKEVMDARARATNIKVDINDSQSLARFQQVQGQLQSSFSRLMAVAEAYPDLKSTKAFMDFQTQIEGTENRINVARQDYNKAVNAYNLKVKTFPSNVFSGIFGFHAKPFYNANPGSENPPDINFDIK